MNFRGKLESGLKFETLGQIDTTTWLWRCNNNLLQTKRLGV